MLGRASARETSYRHRTNTPKPKTPAQAPIIILCEKPKLNRRACHDYDILDDLSRGKKVCMDHFQIWKHFDQMETNNTLMPKASEKVKLFRGDFLFAFGRLDGCRIARLDELFANVTFSN